LKEGFFEKPFVEQARNRKYGILQTDYVFKSLALSNFSLPFRIASFCFSDKILFLLPAGRLPKR